MMSSSELQRISLSAQKVVAIEGTVDLLPLNEEEAAIDVEQDDDDNVETDQQVKSTAELGTVQHSSSDTHLNLNLEPTTSTNGEYLTNGNDKSPSNGANDTMSSSVGDLTLDSVRDHLNSTVTTIHSTTTEEIVGKQTASLQH